ncbi:fido domain-containing protein [Cristinia sonorae]|uniref:Fido domain-containing protein n=1 Tax=Cristinia sonorae TaxID=1940300 RepID=A0A8K0UVY0_9AGAR|nr:fido domain-containing protein [Cristinia sonorae]
MWPLDLKRAVSTWFTKRQLPRDAVEEHTEHVDVARPPDIHNVAILRLPPICSEVLGEELYSELLQSLKYDASNGPEYAASARLWEKVLQSHRLPFLLNKVAEVRWILGSRNTAISLYNELFESTGDPVLGNWLRAACPDVRHQSDRMLNEYNSKGTTLFAQKWRSTALHDQVFPASQDDTSQTKYLRDLVARLSETGMIRYRYRLCIETTQAEGVVQFSSQDVHQLSMSGFDVLPRYFSGEFEGFAAVIESGQVRNLDDAIAILRDTYRALGEVEDFARVNPRKMLTPDVICGFHRTLMKTSQVLYVFSEPDAAYKHSYTNIGVTRSTSRVNVSAGGEGSRIQFCPYNEVDAELLVFCQRFNDLMERVSLSEESELRVHPFMAAAWIQHVFITIHPFEDGNGRIARLLSSIPLIQKGLPPLSVPHHIHYQRYIAALNESLCIRDSERIAWPLNEARIPLNLNITFSKGAKMLLSSQRKRVLSAPSSVTHGAVPDQVGISSPPNFQNTLLLAQIPTVDILGTDLHLTLIQSLNVSPSEGSAYATSARFWEYLLDRGHRLPFLLRKVAELRWNLGSKIASITLYDELYGLTRDKELAKWLQVTRPLILQQAEDSLKQYLQNDPSAISQPWRSTIIHDAVFPRSKDSEEEMHTLHRLLNKLTDVGMVRYRNRICIETTQTEGVVQFCSQDVHHLSISGFDVLPRYFSGEFEGLSAQIEGGQVRDLDVAISIFRDAQQALEEVEEFSRTHPRRKLTVKLLCGFHRTLMKTSQVLHVFSPETSSFKHSYVNIGVTRATSRTNVYAGSPGTRIQFCPYNEVDAELNVFCQRFSDLMDRVSLPEDSDLRVDPFAAAAWVHHVFITIHPFEDGNGRMARLLSSIPLIRNGLPPMCIPQNFHYPLYISTLNEVRARRDHDYGKLQYELMNSTTSALRLATALQLVE